jgi:hypothetical protein
LPSSRVMRRISRPTQVASTSGVGATARRTFAPPSFSVKRTLRHFESVRLAMTALATSRMGDRER